MQDFRFTLYQPPAFLDDLENKSSFSEVQLATPLEAIRQISYLTHSFVQPQSWMLNSSFYFML